LLPNPLPDPGIHLKNVRKYFKIRGYPWITANILKNIYFINF